MKTIASFEVDHTKLVPGIYISRIDGDITTYDLRFVVPNGGAYLPVAAMHTIEHLFAVYARNSAYGAHIIYFGPMGCRTGFYLLVRDADHAKVLDLIRDCADFVIGFDGQIPGCSRRECGNYLEHDLAAAKQACAEYAQKIASWTPQDLEYVKA